MKTFTQNETTYTTHQITIGKTIFAVTVATGKFNYVSIRKTTNNPFGSLGTEFKNFDEAVSSYKNRTMKVELLKIEMGLN